MIDNSKKLSDKRKFRRLDFHAKASAKGDHWSFSGEITNISNTGAYLATRGPYAVNDRIDLILSFQRKETKIAFTVPCRVARVDGGGVGLVSPHMDVNNLMRMKLLFDLYGDNPRELVEEFCKSI